jgi:hypothetical protein
MLSLKRNPRLKKATLANLVLDENGSMALWFPVLLVAMLIFSVWILETGKILCYQADLQTAADAASLAGVSTAEVVPIVEHGMEFEEPETGSENDDSNLPSKITEKVVGWDVTVKKNKADIEAKKLLAPNISQSIGWENWESNAEKDTYSVILKDVKLATPIEKFLGTVQIRAESISKAFAKKEVMP